MLYVIEALKDGLGLSLEDSHSFVMAAERMGAFDMGLSEGAVIAKLSVMHTQHQAVGLNMADAIKLMDRVSHELNMASTAHLN